MEVDQTAKKQKQRLADHVRELRNRLFMSIAILFVASGGVYFIYVPILNFLRAPLHQTLYYDSPAGSLAFIMKLCVIGGVLIAMPILAYNIIQFIKPAFRRKMSVYKIVLVSIVAGILAVAGAAFGYFIILADALRFFNGFQVDGLRALISADNYLNFVTNVILTFVLMFQIPIVIGFWNRIRPIKPTTILKGEKWVIGGSLIIGAIVPFTYDMITCILIAMPIIVLYNISLLYIMFSRIGKPVEEIYAIEKPIKGRRVKRQLNAALEPLNWLEEPIETPTFSGQLVNTKGAMDLRRRPVESSEVQPPAWYIEKQEKLRQAREATYGQKLAA